MCIGAWVELELTFNTEWTFGVVRGEEKRGGSFDTSQERRVGAQCRMQWTRRNKVGEIDSRQAMKTSRYPNTDEEKKHINSRPKHSSIHKQMTDRTRNIGKAKANGIESVPTSASICRTNLVKRTHRIWFEKSNPDLRYTSAIVSFFDGEERVWGRLLESEQGTTRFRLGLRVDVTCTCSFSVYYVSQHVRVQ